MSDYEFTIDLQRESLADANATIGFHQEQIKFFREETKRLRDRIAELEAAVQWHPASEPPDDGKHVLLWRDNICFVGYCTVLDGRYTWILNAPGLPVVWPKPTHWRDMPPLPDAEAQK